MPQAINFDQDTKVYRALRASSWVDPDTNKVLPVAFYLRTKIHTDGSREEGLSILITDSCPTQADCQRIIPSLKTKGVCSLNVGEIEEQNLSVVVTRDEKGEILGLPYQDEDLVAAKYHAETLANKSQLEGQW